MNIKKQLGTKIKRLRQNRGFTQEQLAEKLDIATRTLCGIENGENFLTAETLEKILRVLNISSSELFAFDHLRPQEELVEEIIHDLRDIKSREKIENIYKLFTVFVFADFFKVMFQSNIAFVNFIGNICVTVCVNIFQLTCADFHNCISVMF